MQRADQFGRAAQGQIGSGIRRKPVPMAGLPKGVHSDVALEEGQHFPVALGPQHPGRARETGCLQVVQVLVHGGRPRPHRPQQPITAAYDPAGHPPARDRHLACSRMLVIGHQASITGNAGPPKSLPAMPGSKPAARDDRTCRGEMHGEALNIRLGVRLPQT